MERFWNAQEVMGRFEHFADRPFLIEPSIDRVLSYGETWMLACRAANMMAARGIRPGDRVAVVLVNNAEFAAFFFGCFAMGVTLVPVNPALHATEVDFILHASRARAVVFSLCTRPLVLEAPRSAALEQIFLLTAQEEGLHSGEPGPIRLDDALGGQPKGWTVVAERSADEVFTMGFTSGTTSRPKGVQHRVASLFENAAAFNEVLQIGADRVFMNVWPMAYSSGYLNNMVCAFMAGARMVIGRAFDAQSVLQFWKPVLAYGVNMIWLSPSMLAALTRVDRDSAGLAYARERQPTFCVGTAPLPLKVKQDFEQKYGVEVYESYGLSELLLISANTPRYPRVPGSAGRLLSGVDVDVVGEDGARKPAGEEGEIVVRSPWLMKGYLNVETGEADVLSPAAPFPTGDIGRVDDAGNISITARKKDLIIRGGFNISPRQVEDVLLDHPAVEQAAVVGIPHHFYGEEVIAFVKLRAGADMAEENGKLMTRCLQHLNRMAVPSRILAIDRFPVTSTGKIQKNELRVLLLAPASSKAAPSPTGA